MLSITLSPGICQGICPYTTYSRHELSVELTVTFLHNSYAHCIIINYNGLAQLAQESKARQMKNKIDSHHTNMHAKDK